jgi:hypothetical protein
MATGEWAGGRAITGVNLSVDAGFLAAVPWMAYGGLRGPA